MDVYHIALVVGIGIIAGFLNTVAGGGSLLTMPVLIFLGLPSAVANGTNRIAIMAQNIVAITNFRKKGYFDWKIGIVLAVPAAIGAIVGSHIAVSISDSAFNKALAVVMILVLVMIMWNPHKKLETDKETFTLKDKIIGMAVFFGVGVYGGFIQAGVGFIIIASLTLLTGYSLVKVNSIKVFVVAIYMIFSLIVFIINGKVDWILGLSLAVGNGFGAYLGSNFAVQKGDRWIKAVLAVAVVAMALKLLGIIKIG